jgi:hypothetical protein
MRRQRLTRAALIVLLLFVLVIRFVVVGLLLLADAARSRSAAGRPAMARVRSGP